MFDSEHRLFEFEHFDLLLEQLQVHFQRLARGSVGDEVASADAV